ncbi:uncharacterized protein LOC143418413 isoform X1 [Maylandia zebra]|uniref:uncharacterized protein LOC143418413 isoform X1 n=1 Tax=Maylandia zebra TaxID=106582 RepID=UPI00403C1A83
MRRGGRVDMMGVTEYRIGRSSALCWCLQTWTAVSPPVCFGWKRRLTADTQMNISQAPPPAHLWEHRGIPSPAERYNLSSVLWVFPGTSTHSCLQMRVCKEQIRHTQPRTEGTKSTRN